jgi:hypothetical protein
VLSEADSGSDALSLRTRATLAPDGRHYVINGEKMWITNAAFAEERRERQREWLAELGRYIACNADRNVIVPRHP